ncbi:MAG: DUF424 domain-containing protein [Thermoprotei archaeon]|nr:MAG: DUF424 domain-containing protein [Thermoprotei archaeon]
MAGKESNLVYVKEFESSGELIVAVCDSDLLGKTISDDKISVYIDPVFYGGRLIDIEEALRLIDRSTIANLFGSKIVTAAMEKGLVHPDSVIEINGVLHAQIIKVF